MKLDISQSLISTISWGLGICPAVFSHPNFNRKRCSSDTTSSRKSFLTYLCWVRCPSPSHLVAQCWLYHFMLVCLQICFTTRWWDLSGQRLCLIFSDTSGLSTVPIVTAFQWLWNSQMKLLIEPSALVFSTLTRPITPPSPHELLSGSHPLRVYLPPTGYWPVWIHWTNVFLLDHFLLSYFFKSFPSPK